MSTQQEHALRQAAELADAVHEHAHFGEMFEALRHAERALKQGQMALPEDVSLEEAVERLKRGRLVLALAMELWTERRV